MIAYNHEWLDHLNIRREVDDAFYENCLTAEEREIIHKKYPVGFYTPNVFIGIGLLLLTIIIMLFSFGLLVLMFLSNGGSILGALAIFFSVACYAALEYMIRVKKHFSSGVDEGLLWGASIALFCGISIPHDLSEILNCIIIFMISLFGSIRYADRLMTTVLYFSFLSIIFYTCVKMGSAAKTIVPFIIMIVSILTYISVQKIRSKKTLLHYTNCLTMIEISSLISLYAAGNYFMVRELSNQMFHLYLKPGESIPFGWLFWIFTAIIPIVYLVRGIQKKNVLLIRIGLLLFAAIVFTVRYYHTILPIEIMMTIAGVLIFAIAYGLMKWLHEPVHMFTSRSISSKNELDKLQIESLILAQTFKPGTDAGGTKFGGGSFGGGGASGEY